MKLLKKVLAGALSLAVVAGAMFAFTGCNSVRNKTYAIEDYTVTLVKAVDEDGKITETQTLSYREYFIHKFCNNALGVKVEEIATYVMTAEEEEMYATNFKLLTEGIVAEFGKDEVRNIKTVKDEFLGTTVSYEQVAEYEVKDNVIIVKAQTSTNDPLQNENEYVTYTLEIVDGKIYQKTTEIPLIASDYEGEDTVWENGDVCYATAIYAEVK